MKIVLFLCLLSPLLAGNNRTDGEFNIQEKSDQPDKFPVLQPISQSNNGQNRNQQQANQPLRQMPRQQNSTQNSNILKSIEIPKNNTQRNNNNGRMRNVRRNPRDGARGADGRDSTPTSRATDGKRGQDGRVVSNLQPITKEFDVMVPEQVAQQGSSQNRGSNGRNNGSSRQVGGGQAREAKRSVRLQPLNNTGAPRANASGPRFISFGQNQGQDLQYQNLLSKILNFGMLSMFTDLTDQSTKISLMLVLKQDKQIAGKDIFKVIYKVDNPKYVTGTIYYGAEFAVTSGVTNPNPNQIDFISFGKSVILENLLKLLSIDQDVARARASLNHMNDSKNKEGLDFNGQSKSSMVEFIQTILSLTQSELGEGKGAKEDCPDKDKGMPKKNESTLIGSGLGDLDYLVSGDRI